MSELSCSILPIIVYVLHPPSYPNIDTSWEVFKFKLVFWIQWFRYYCFPLFRMTKYEELQNIFCLFYFSCFVYCENLSIFHIVYLFLYFVVSADAYVDVCILYAYVLCFSLSFSSFICRYRWGVRLQVIDEKTTYPRERTYDDEYLRTGSF